FIHFFADEVIQRCKEDLYGEAQLKQKLLSDFKETKLNVFLYNNVTNKKLRFKKFFGIARDQNVYLVTDDETKTNWIAKWEGYVDENAESKTYRKLEGLGAHVPMRLDGFKLLDFGVLVMELLYPLDITDRPSLVAKELLQQLKVIHTFSCYFDLKTDNIRKSNSNPPKYFIIDVN